MINALIIATVTLTVVYMLAAFIHHSMASICRRHKAAIAQTVSEVVEVVATVALETITPMIELPTKIRDLRQFVREHSLQDAIKSITGKSVSNLKKDELHNAVMMAIA